MEKQVRFNHVGFTIPRDLLDEAGRLRITDFFGTVFGFEERSEFTKDKELLVLMAGGPDQFIVFFGHERPTVANPPTDHFGMAVGSREQLDTYRERIVGFQKNNPSIELSELEVSTFQDVQPYTLHRFYVRFATPFAFEVQYYQWLDATADVAQLQGAPASL